MYSHRATPSYACLLLVSPFPLFHFPLFPLFTLLFSHLYPPLFSLLLLSPPPSPPSLPLQCPLLLFLFLFFLSNIFPSLAWICREGIGVKGAWSARDCGRG